MGLNQRWAALSARGKWISIGMAAVLVWACGSAGRPQPITVPNSTALATLQATVIPATLTASVSIHTAAPMPTSAPTPTVAPTRTAMPTPTVAPTPAPTPVPPVSIATISFGEDYTQGSSSVRLSKTSEEFNEGSEVAWRVELPPATGTETILVEVRNAADAIVFSGTHDPDAGSNVYFGKTMLAEEPGEYTMRYLLNGNVIAVGSFAIAPAAAASECDPSYPDFCISFSPPDLDCKDVLPHQDFTVIGDDPHRFDADNDGIGCEPYDGPAATPKPKPQPTKKPTKPNNTNRNCDPSYPTLCLPSSPDLDCGQISARRFPVRGRDPHGFDGDGDGIGCES